MVRETCKNPFIGMYESLGDTFDRKMDEFLYAGDVDVRKYFEDIHGAGDWRKCKIPEVLKPYIKKGYKPSE